MWDYAGKAIEYRHDNILVNENGWLYAVHSDFQKILIFDISNFEALKTILKKSFYMHGEYCITKEQQFQKLTDIDRQKLKKLLKQPAE